VLLTIAIYAVCLVKCTSACDLAPGTDGISCSDLTATPYITFDNSQFGQYIEGASVTPDGDVFAVNYGNNLTNHKVGQVYPEQRLFYTDGIRDSYFNGIRFFNSHTAFVADKTHRVLKLNLGPGNVVISSENFCRDPTMIEPNDLALSVTGTIYTSGM